MDEESGTSSRLIDLPNGGFSIVMGNVLMQGNNAPNNNLLGYGLEGLTSAEPHDIYIVNNTFVNERMASCLFISLQDGSSHATIMNNIFAGAGVLYDGPEPSMSNNLISDDISQLDFADEAMYDYSIGSASTAIDYGAAVSPVRGYSLIPDSTYQHPTDFGIRVIVNGIIDAGAYESGQLVSHSDLSGDELSLYPNPTHGTVLVKHTGNPIVAIEVYDALGGKVLRQYDNGEVDLSDMPTSIYHFHVALADGSRVVRRVIKE